MTSSKLTLKMLQAKLNKFEEEIENVKEELTDVKTKLRNAEQKLESVKIKGVSEESNILNCRVCDKLFDTRASLKLHLKDEHIQKAKCTMCEELFDRNCDMENHIRNIHESFETYDCDKCEKTFVLEWRLRKHREGHDRILKKCHYFNNQKSCPYENVGCMFDHAFSGSCKYGKKCTNKMCPFQHDHGTTENDSDIDKELKDLTNLMVWKV